MKKRADYSKLTPKQEDFCRAYLIDGNATEAYRQAYPTSRAWKPNAVNGAARKNVYNPKIIKRIKELRAGAAKRNDISVDRVLREEQRLCFADPILLFELETGTLISPHKLSEDIRRAIAGFEAQELPKLYPDEPQRYKFKYKFWDKGRSLERMGKHLGIFEKDNLQRGKVMVEMD